MTDQPATPRTGGCLCGAVRYTVTAPPLNVRICHCRLCQQATGQPFFARAIFPRDAVAIEGDTRAFRSSPDLERRFCATCGTSLFAGRLSAPQRMAVTLASLDDPQALPPDAQFWTSSRIAWVADLGSIPDFEAWPPA